MAKNTTQPSEDEAPCEVLDSHVRDDGTRPPLFAPSNQPDSPKSPPSFTRLQVGDFYNLVRSSSAAIACVDFPSPVPCAPESSAPFSEALYLAPSLCLEASESFARLRGVRCADDLIEKPLAALAPRDDGFRALFAEWHRRRFTLEGLEWRVLDAEGAQRVINAALYGTFRDGALTRFWIVLRDISALARAINATTTTERHYRELFEHPDLLYLKSYADGVISYASATTQQELDLNASTSSHLDQVLRTACHPDDRSLLERLLYHRRAQANEPVSTTLRLIGRVSGLTTYNLIQHPHRVGTETDAFEIVGAKASQKSETLSDTTFSAGLAHDANNQLLVASAAIERVRQSFPDSHHSRLLLDSALRSIAYCASIHSQSINLSAGVQPHRGRIVIASLFADVVQQCEAILPDGIAMHTSLQDDRIAMWADRTHLNQVLMNLVLNARDALGSSGVITLNATRRAYATSDPPAARLRPVIVSVSDTGPGLDIAATEKIFQPFFSTKSGLRTRGLGLTMVKALVEKNGGEIAVTSAQGFGTTFTMSLPEAPLQSAIPGQRAAQLEPHRRLRCPNVRALIADDEPEVRKALLWSLISQGIEASAVPDAASLMRELTRPNSHYNLIILDVGMPGSTAQQLRDAISSRTPNMPVIITSGDASLAAEMPNSKRCRFLAKPFALAELLRCIESVCATNG